MKRVLINISIAALLFIVVPGCKKQIFVADSDVIVNSASHSNGFPANYKIVFDESKVNRLEFIFTSAEWQAMQTDLSTKQRGGGPPGQFNDENPDYFHCIVRFNDLVWNNVGIRYKGNSSLNARSGKLPLRLKFDKWEDEFPEIQNQRFYGFKDLSLSSNYNDAALMREKSACDVFRDFGVPAVRTVFYEIYIDNGSGTLEYYGLYTVLEMVDDTFLDDWFGSNSGNCYKPDGDGAQFAASNFTLNDFELKTNETIADRSEIQEMYDILHSSLRTSDAAQWRSNLERVFDVDGFLKYLAVNNTIQNWDTNGKMSHNYYLYHDPKDGLIKWIVWDNNEAFQTGKQGGAVSLSMSEVGTDWPLLSFLIADNTYEATYKTHIKSFITSSFASSRMSGIYTSQQSLLTSSATAERSGYSYVNGIGNFNSAVSALQSHNTTRISAASAYAQ